MKNKRILLVDDDPSITRFIGRILHEVGKYEVLAIHEGMKALAKVREFNPDLIFIDIAMPDLDGTAVTEQIRQDPTLNHIAIIYITGAITPTEAQNSDGHIGGQIFLAKPIDPGLLISYAERYASV